MEVENITELPGEANPLTESILLHVLKGAASTNPQQIQTSTKQLQTWETQKHYFVHLQSAFIDRRLPLEIRYLAIIQLKNGIDKYWRKTANNAVDPEDKNVIRSRLLESGINEGDQRLALQNALVIAKVVRYEFPTTWPDVIPQIIQVLLSSSTGEPNQLRLSRALLITKYIVKELATGRLRSIKESLQSIAPNLLQVVGTIYFNGMQSALTGLRSGDAEDHYFKLLLEQTLLAIKVVRRLAVGGYESPNRSPEVRQLSDNLSSNLEELLHLNYGGAAIPSDTIRQLLDRHLIQIAKFHLEMARVHPIAFVLMNGTQRIQQYWQLVSNFGESYGSRSIDFAKLDPNGDANTEGKSPLEKGTFLTAGKQSCPSQPNMQSACIKALLIIRACLKTLSNPQQSLRFSRDEKREEEKEEAVVHLKGLFTDDFLRNIMDVLVRCYFVLREKELAEWEDESEEWERREGEGEDFETSIRICAEKLFLDVAISHKKLVIQPLVAAFQSISSPDNEDVILKDSIYTAVGLAAPVLHESIDFDGLIQNTLVVEVKKQQHGFKILRRRIAILLGQWIPIKVSETSRPTVYEIFRHLLQKGEPLNDEVVRITAGKQFKNVADAWEFNAVQFLPYAPDILSQLMALIEEVELSDTKLALLNTVSVLVERMEHHITPFADRIISLLPALWEQSGSEHLMKQAILAILSRLFISMKATGARYHPLALGIIRGAVEPGSETAVYLLDDALDLWESIVLETPTPSATSDLNPDLISMMEYLIPTLSLGSEALRKALTITEQYLLLAPTVVLADPFLGTLLKTLSELLGQQLKPDANGLLTNVIEQMILAAEALGGAQAVCTLTASLVSSGTFGVLIRGVQESWTAHQTTGPKTFTSAIQGLVETDYFSLLARITFTVPETLLEALQAVPEAASPPTPLQAMPGRAAPQGIEATMAWLLDEWFTHTEDVSDPGRRKLMAMALTRLLELHLPFILNRLQSLMSMWTDVLVELAEGNEDLGVDSEAGANGASLFERSELVNPGEERKTLLQAGDPVRKVNLMPLVRDALMGCVQRSGGEAQFREEWLVNVDKEVISSFSALGIL